VGYTAKIVGLGQAFLRVLQFFPVSNIPQMLHTHLHVDTISLRSTCGQSLGNIKNQCFFECLGSLDKRIILISSIKG
jgi:hypothetical protein